MAAAAQATSSPHKSITITRELTPTERIYLNSRIRALYIGRALMIAVSILFCILALSFLFAIPSISKTNISHLPLFAFLAIGILAASAFIAKTLWRRRFFLDEGVYTYKGHFECNSVSVYTPTTGGATRVKSFRINGVLMHFPVGTQDWLQRYHGTEATILAAHVRVSNPLRGLEDEVSPIVLEFEDKIRIHQALEKYGLKIFKSYIQRQVIAMLLVAAAAIWLVTEIASGKKYLDDILNIGVFGIMAWTIGILLFLSGLVCLIEYIGNALGWRHISLEEKLRG